MPSARQIYHGLNNFRGWFVLAFLAVLVFLSARGFMIRHSANGDRSRITGTEVSSESEKPGRYAGSASCRECHEEEYRLWDQSHHQLAQRPPIAGLDEKAFSPSRALHLAGTSVSVAKRGSEYVVSTDGPAGTQQMFRVESVIGHAPLRQFLVSFPGGRLQTLEASYDTRSNEWFDVFGKEDRRPGEWGHWTGRGMNWNSMCATCHNTRLRKGYEEVSDTYHTTMAESAVGCEACHGPLEEHNNWQKKFGKSRQADPTLPHWPKQRATDNCGFCHARRAELTGDFKPGDDFLDQMRPTIVDSSETFYADGQVHEEDYEYAPFLGSRMYSRGVQCSDCHDPHSAKLKLPGNWVCMRCHNGSYTNAPLIDPVGHSHHKVFGYGSSGEVLTTDLTGYREEQIRETGGQCVNCHMPQTTYMQRHRRHDHGFTIPDPLLTKQAGIPNACNRCHQDNDANWAAKYCDEWYGAKMDRPSRARALLVSAARRNDASAPAGLVGMLSTDDISYWRAAAAGLLTAWAGDPFVRQKLTSALNDTNALVRLECVAALESSAPLPEVTQALRRRLADPVRAVRVAAAWACRAQVDTPSSAGVDLSRFMSVSADQPAGQMQQGSWAMARGDLLLASEHYHKAVAWDPNSAVSRHDYAIVLARLNHPTEAIEQLQAACRLEPTNADFQFELALGWNEAGRSDQAIACLRAALRLDPGFAKAWYNLGLALSSDGKTEEALEALTRAESADSSDPRAPYARASILGRLGALEEARKAARKAIAIDPGFEPARQLLQSLQ